jgi:hypothetical protein
MPYGIIKLDTLVYTSGGLDASTSVSGLVGGSFNNISASGTVSGASFIPTGSSVPTNGLYLPSSNNVAISTNSSQRLLIDASGNVNIDSNTLYIDATNNRVGLGTTSPGKPLDVRGTGSVNVGSFSNGTQGIDIATTASGGSIQTYDQNQTLDLKTFGTTTNSINFSVGSTERARIDSSGRLLVGTSSSTGSARAVFQGNSFSSGQPGIILIQRDTSSSGLTAGAAMGYIIFGDNVGSNYAVIGCEADGATGTNDYPSRLVFSVTRDGQSSPTEALRITNGGAVSCSPQATGADLVGTEACGFVADSIYAPVYKIKSALTSLKNCAIFQNGNGVVGSIQMNGSSTSYNTSSDYRLKENVVPLTGATDRVNQLQVHRFNFIADPSKTVDGFLAHEAQEVVPECVTGTKDEVDDEGNPVYQGIDQSKLVPLLTAALQEALQKIEDLEGRLTAAGI